MYMYICMYVAVYLPREWKCICRIHGSSERGILEMILCLRSETCNSSKYFSTGWSGLVEARNINNNITVNDTTGY